MKNKNMMVWLIVLIVVIVFINLLIFVPRSSSDKIKVGAIVPLTGDYATLGTRIKNGMELAKTNLEIKNNISIKIYYEDVCLSKDAIPAVQKLTDIDRVSWIGSSFCVVGLTPNIPILEQKKIISFNTAANPDMVLNHPYVFSTNKAIKDDATELADFAINKLDAKTVSIIYYNVPFGVDYGKYFSNEFKRLGGKVLSDQPYEVSQKEFRTELTRIKNEKSEVIFVIGLPGPMGNFLKEAKELGIESQILSFSFMTFIYSK